jgi:SAM-dependent methyltransferase
MQSALIIALISAIFALLGLILTILVFIQLLIFKAPYVRTSKPVRDAILKEIHLGKNDIVYDLGCGNGQMLIDIEKQTGAMTIGYDISPLARMWAEYAVKTQKAKAKIHLKNFFKQNISDASLVYCFLIPSLMPRVEKFLHQQLKPGTPVIAYAFPFPNWQPVKVVETLPNGNKSSKIYIYNK